MEMIIVEQAIDGLPQKWLIELLKYLLNPLLDETDIKELKKRKAILDITNEKRLWENIKDKSEKDEEKLIIKIGDTSVQWGRADYGIKKTSRK